MTIDHDGATLAFGILSDLTSAHKLSVYDAAYFVLALRRRLPLACKDGPLRQAARRAGLALWKA